MSDTPTGPPPGPDQPSGPPPGPAPTGPPPAADSPAGPPPASGPPASEPPASGPPPSGPPTSGEADQPRQSGKGGSGGKWLSGLLVLALIGGSAWGLQASGLLDTLMGSDEADAEVVTEVLLEARTSPGTDPFTMAVDNIQDVDPVPAPPPADAQGAAATTVTLDGADVGLYGGTNDNTLCDVEQMIAFLEQDPAKQAAWAQVQGITAEAVSGYLRELTPAIVNVDTRVTNHGFRDGGPFSLQSVLQAGTAVLVDDEGVPRARCACGNPLLAPAVTPRVQYTGTAWDGFDPQRTVRAPGPPPALPAPDPAATGAPPDVGGPNLVVNGGAEAPLDPPWGTGIYEANQTELFWGAANATMVRDTDNPRTGGSAIRIDNQSPVEPQIYRTMAQQVSVTPGTQYCLRAWVRTAPGSQPGVLFIALDDAWAVRVNAPFDNASWNEISLSFVADKDTIDVRLVSENTGTAWVDDLSLTPC